MKQILVNYHPCACALPVHPTMRGRGMIVETT